MEDKERTIYVGNLSDKVTEDLLYELFLQAGPLENVTIPKDKDGRQRNFAFIAFKHPVSVPYSIALMNGISLFGRPLCLNARSGSNEPNPYLEQLQQYAFAASQRSMPNTYGHYQQNDNRYQQNDNRHPQNNNRYPHSDNRYQHSDRYNRNGYRRQDLRRNEGRANDLQLPGPLIYPGYSQPQSGYNQLQSGFLTLPQIPPPPTNFGSQVQYESYPSTRSGYRR